MELEIQRLEETSKEYFEDHGEEDPNASIRIHSRSQELEKRRTAYNKKEIVVIATRGPNGATLLHHCAIYGALDAAYELTGEKFIAEQLHLMTRMMDLIRRRIQNAETLNGSKMCIETKDDGANHHVAVEFLKEWGVPLEKDTVISLIQFIAEHQVNATQFEQKNQWALQEELDGQGEKGAHNMTNAPVGWNGFGKTLTIEAVVPLKYLLADKRIEHEEFHHKFEDNSLMRVYLNSRDANGCTSLHLAAIHGEAKIARLLLNSGADPALLSNVNGWSALHYAAHRGSAGVCQEIVDNIVSEFVHPMRELERVTETGQMPAELAATADARRVIEAAIELSDPRRNAAKLLQFDE